MAVQLETDVVIDPGLTNGIFPPVLDGITGFWEHVTGRYDLNQITGVRSAVVGAPTVTAKSATFTGMSHYLETDVSETAEATLMQVSRILDPAGSTGGGLTMLIASISSDTAGMAMWAAEQTSVAAPAGRIRTSAYFNNAALLANLNESDITPWRLRSLRVLPGTGTFVNNLTSGTSAAGSSANTRNVSSRKLRIGSSYSATYTGRVEAMLSATYSRSLTTGELATMRAWMQTLVTALDNTVTI